MGLRLTGPAGIGFVPQSAGFSAVGVVAVARLEVTHAELALGGPGDSVAVAAPFTAGDWVNARNRPESFYGTDPAAECLMKVVGEARRAHPRRLGRIVSCA